MQDLPHFDFLMRLAKNNPEKLDELQAQLNQQLIANSTNPELLKRVWSDYEKRVERCNTPMERCLTASDLMQQKLKTLAHTLNGTLDDKSGTNQDPTKTHSNNCLEFPKK